MINNVIDGVLETEAVVSGTAPARVMGLVLVKLIEPAVVADGPPPLIPSVKSRSVLASPTPA